MSTVLAQPVRPDYDGGSLLNLIATCAAARGAQPTHPTLRQLPPDSIETATHLVLLLIDGLGHTALRRLGAGSCLERHLAAAITSVFPSTTAAAITTSFTGASPLEHGLTGWFLHLPEAGGVVRPLPFRPRGLERSLTQLGIRPQALHARGSLLDTLDAEVFAVLPRDIADSEYSRHGCGAARRLGYEGIDGLVDAVESAVRASPRRKFVYAYYAEFDATAHRFGVDGPQARAELARVDAGFEALRARLAGTDTVIIATADHGFIDSSPLERHTLDEFPSIGELLRLPLCGEPRVAFCHVLPGRADELIARAREALAGIADACTGAELVADGWLGPGVAHPRIAERVGDVALVMRAGHVLRDFLPGEPRHVLIGNHGGASADEMYIPLVVARV